MKAVILAAGRGTRICSVMGCICKQLIRIRGVELFLYPIFSLFSAGVESFIVVTNPIVYDSIDKILREHSNRLGFDYVLTLNPYRNSGNGNSLIIGLKEADDESVLVSVSDHIFSPEIVSILSRHIGIGDIVVAADPSPVLVDIVEATKIRADNDKIIRVGKDIEAYDYIDMGLFVVNKPWRVTSMFREDEYVSLSDILNNIEIDARVSVIRNKLWKDLDVLKISNILSRIHSKQ